MTKAIIVGCGLMAGGGSKIRLDSYAAAMWGDPSWKLVGGVDSDLLKARDFAERHSCSAWSDLPDALEAAKPDVVIVATPDSGHFEVVRTVLMNSTCPAAVVVEKPICSNHVELAEIERLSSRRGCLVVVNHSRRFDSRYQAIRLAIREGRLGALVKARAVYYGGWRHNGVHVVDSLAFLFDEAPVWQSVTGEVPGRVSDDPTISVTGKLASVGAAVEVEGVDETNYQLFEFDFRFIGGRIQISDFDASFELQQAAENALGERVLESMPIDLKRMERTTTAELLEAVSDYVREGRSDRLADVGVDAVRRTMDSLWQGGAISELDRSEPS